MPKVPRLLVQCFHVAHIPIGPDKAPRPDESVSTIVAAKTDKEAMKATAGTLKSALLRKHPSLRERPEFMIAIAVWELKNLSETPGLEAVVVHQVRNALELATKGES
jgi:hypothetical protein